MKQKLVSGDCLACESGFEVSYTKELVSSEYPQFCPFCGEAVEDITDEYIEEDGDFGDEEWEN